jgi:hypothetical protein
MSKVRKVSPSSKAAQNDAAWLKVMGPHLDKLAAQSMSKYCRLCGAPVVNNGDGNYFMELEQEVHIACLQKHIMNERMKAAEQAAKEAGEKDA